MTKNIEITETRECCQEGKGDFVEVSYLQCIHCGDQWEYRRVTDAAGDVDSELVRRPKE